MKYLFPDRVRRPPFGASRGMALLCVVLAASSPGGFGWAQEGAPELEMVALHVTPQDPGPDTLCKLRVTLRNRGEAPVSVLAFDVELGGEKLPIYERQLFLRPIAAGETVDLELFNFWTSESDRPVPSSGRLELRVRLKSASWMQTETVVEDGESIEVWRPVSDVEGLPITRERVLELRADR